METTDTGSLVLDTRDLEVHALVSETIALRGASVLDVYAENRVYDPNGDTRSLSTYEHLDVFGHMIPASHIDLGLESL